jgi:YVTN family beta-propeller protein
MLLVIASLSKSGDCANNPEVSVAPPGVLFELLALNKDIPTVKLPKYRSPIDIKGSPDGKQIYVAEQTAKRIAVIDLTTKTVIKTISLPNEPTGIAVAPTTGLLYVTCSSDLWPDGMVCEVSVPQGIVVKRMPAGHGACSPVLAHTGQILYVCNRFSDNISVINIASGLLIETIHTWREPLSADITPDDGILVVANSLPVQKSTDTLSVASRIILISTQTKQILEAIPLPTGSHSVMGVKVSPDGNYAFATHLIGMFALPATTVERGWIHTNNCAVVDIKNKKILNDATLDSPLMGAGNPWGIACSPDGKYVCIAHSGSNELSIIDLKTFIAVAETSNYSGGLITAIGDVKTLSHNLAGILNICDKITVKSKAPRAITVVGNQVITAGYFGDAVEVFDLSMPGSGTKTFKSATIDLGTPVPMTSERQGECAYYDASLCFQSWQSCHSCHPFTRTDGLNWTLRGPLVTPRNAKSFVLSWWTPPMNWSGSRPNCRESIRYGMANELFLDPDYTIAAYLDTFFMTLKPIPSPYLAKGKLSGNAKLGQAIYNIDTTRCDCKKCHPAPLYTNMLFKYSYIPDRYDNNQDWDVPTVLETWRGAPYNHLGSMDNIDTILRWKGHSTIAEKLTAQEYIYLKEFVLSL